MTTEQPTPPKAALVAIDIAKNRHEVLIEPGPRMRRRRLSVLNNRAEHDRLVATLHGLGKPVPGRNLSTSTTSLTRTSGRSASPALSPSRA